VLVAASFLILSLALVVFVRRRRQFARLPLIARATRAVGACGLTLVSFVLFTTGAR
jgi:hypothetical protein